MSKRELVLASWHGTRRQTADGKLALPAPSVVGFAIEANGGDLDRARAYALRVVAILDEVIAEGRDELADTERPRAAGE